jgi:3-deoxy-D-manno-octulosonate 8-phosphate phosphatase (KDO 8-P phosphatase)
MSRAKVSVTSRARRIRMVLLDVDGVLTDGGLYYTAEGHELKRFHAHDGYGIQRGRESGLSFGIITGRTTPIVEARARVLKIEDVMQGAEDKVAAMRDIQRRRGFSDEEFAFIGDDLFDIPLLRVVGLSAAPPNALAEVRRNVHYVTRAAGGEGAVRDFIDLILARRGK